MGPVGTRGHDDTPADGGAAASVRSWTWKGQRGRAYETSRETLWTLEEMEHAALLLTQETGPPLDKWSAVPELRELSSCPGPLRGTWQEEGGVCLPATGLLKVSADSTLNA